MPTGPITYETAMWLTSVIVAASGVVVPILVFAWRVYVSVQRRIAEVERSAEQAAQEARDELARVLTHVAETYATKSGVTAAVERVEGAVERLTGQVEQSMDRISGRIDRLLEAQVHPPTPRRRATS